MPSPARTKEMVAGSVSMDADTALEAGDLFSGTLDAPPVRGHGESLTGVAFLLKQLWIHSVSATRVI